MPLSHAEYYTYQYYTWEYRGRGWFVADRPVYLEPPFIPFFRHGYKPQYVDDGKRHTLVSRFIENIRGKKQEQPVEQEVLDYEELEPFAVEEETVLKAIQVKLPRERKITPEKMKALLVMLSQSGTAISFEILGTAKEIVLQFVCSDADITITKTYLEAYFPECTHISSDELLENIIVENRQTAVIDFGLQQEFVRPIQVLKNFTIDPLTGLFGILEQLHGDEQAGIQILFKEQ